MIEKVGYTRPVATPRSVRRTGSTSASGFSDALSGAQAALEAGEAEAPAAAAAIATTAGLLGLQEVDPDQHERRKAAKRGQLTLDALVQLRDALLVGTLPITTIERLERLVKSERAQTADPLLNGILDEIELRAAVELAKIEVAMGRNES